jgi:hypothetical protein
LIDEVIYHPYLIPIYFWPQDLIVKYENLLIRGKVLKKRIETGQKHFTEETYQQLEQVYDPYGEVPYHKIMRLRMRDVEGGEKIAVSLKEKLNPTDGSETKVPLTLTNAWEDYEIPLSRFAPIQLEKIFMVASIIVEHQACAIEIESIEYLK